MHIPDGFLDPKISFGLMGAAVAVLAYSLAKVKAVVTALAPQKALAMAGKGFANTTKRVLTKVGQQKIYKMGMVAMLIFVAQMFDFIVIQGTSGHIFGGALAAITLGPFAGAIVMAAVVIIQALFLGDGGVFALGANIINMAFFGTLLIYYVYAFLKKYMPEWLSIAISAWLSVIVAASACALTLGFSGAIALGATLSAMLKVHVIVGVAEALLTIVFVKLFRRLFSV